MCERAKIFRDYRLRCDGASISGSAPTTLAIIAVVVKWPITPTASTHTSAVTFLLNSGNHCLFRMSKLPRFTTITHNKKYEKNAVEKKLELALLGPMFTEVTTYCNIMMAASE
jgi:hypothetical protein